MFTIFFTLIMIVAVENSGGRDAIEEKGHTQAVETMFSEAVVVDYTKMND